MNIVLRIAVAIILGAIVTALLDYFKLLTHVINVLIGVAVAITVYFNWDGDFHR